MQFLRLPQITRACLKIAQVTFDPFNEHIKCVNCHDPTFFLYFSRIGLVLFGSHCEQHTTGILMYRAPHPLLHMTSPVVSIYCQSIPGQELWSAYSQGSHTWYYLHG